ncbi:hypothetical protein [Paenibacillus senegalensis]|uniref:hypothetical protein n=1 Tax=Paenibacillus senegalensis TaxID=1465766 RepID=UPI0002881B4B|nr:hypothetical protein [Paenibacillus senegalensis]
MLWIQAVAALVILLIGRILFYSHVKNDTLWILALRYGGFIGITILANLYLGALLTWTLLLMIPLCGLWVHNRSVRKHGNEKHDRS